VFDKLKNIKVNIIVINKFSLLLDFRKIFFLNYYSIRLILISDDWFIDDKYILDRDERSLDQHISWPKKILIANVKKSDFLK